MSIIRAYHETNESEEYGMPAIIEVGHLVPIRMYLPEEEMDAWSWEIEYDFVYTSVFNRLHTYGDRGFVFDARQLIEQGGQLYIGHSPDWSEEFRLLLHGQALRALDALEAMPEEERPQFNIRCGFPVPISWALETFEDK